MDEEIKALLIQVIRELQKINKQLAEQSAVCYTTPEVGND